ncbi:MAG: ATP-binding cassette domain-containing protein [Spirochaetaceae bacterium]|nr:MAG: ATP-binding cassette domain-containing protein [Spirochaetaceae bacterium]
MIGSVNFRSGYPTKLKGIGTRPIVFNGRLNVLYGPNGSGKTTILKTLAALSGCGDGGWCDGRELRTLSYEATVERDDHPVFYQDCYRDSEESFIGADYLESHAHLRSTGEKRIGLVNELVDHIESRFLTYKLRRDERPTLLLDEVDNHIGFAGQSILWGELFGRLCKKYQLIVSTHSIFPILLRRDSSLRRDNIIVLADRYAEICVAELGRAIAYYNKANGGDAG